MNIPAEQKDLYLESLDVLDESRLQKLYEEISDFVEFVEMKELEDINKENFGKISGMRKKEAEEKKKELNSFSFLLHNL
ncbi:MAG: hypothetical protein GY828_03415 [Candidatus Gracilibacteria bacterium]|nr:hypothetical protein [Candidatus Gracilibacteria bacterium]